MLMCVSVCVCVCVRLCLHFVLLLAEFLKGMPKVNKQQVSDKCCRYKIQMYLELDDNTEVSAAF